MSVQSSADMVTTVSLGAASDRGCARAGTPATSSTIASAAPGKTKCDRWQFVSAVKRTARSRMVLVGQTVEPLLHLFHLLLEIVDLVVAARRLLGLGRGSSAGRRRRLALAAGERAEHRG